MCFTLFQRDVHFDLQSKAAEYSVGNPRPTFLLILNVSECGRSRTKRHGLPLFLSH